MATRPAGERDEGAVAREEYARMWLHSLAQAATGLLAHLEAMDAAERELDAMAADGERRSAVGPLAELEATRH